MRQKDQNLSKYQQIERDIRAQIESGALKPGDKLMSEREYMNAYAVSSITVRKAMNGLSDSGLIKRVRGSGSFVGEKLPPASSRRIAVILPCFAHPDVSHLAMLRGVQRYFADRDYSMIVEWCEGGLATEAAAVQKVLQHDIEGLLVYPQSPPDDSEIFARLNDMQLPFVAMDRYDIFAGQNYVGADNYAGGALAAKHLLALGHTRFLFVAQGFHLSSERERFDGFCYTAYGYGVDFGREHVVHHLEADAIAEAIQKGAVTALFCANDLTAMTLIEDLKIRGIKVPRDVSLVGFDKWAMLDQTDTKLTTIKQDFELVGLSAAKLLFELINTPEPPAPTRVLTAVELVIGDTTAENKK